MVVIAIIATIAAGVIGGAIGGSINADLGSVAAIAVMGGFILAELKKRNEK